MVAIMAAMLDFTTFPRLKLYSIILICDIHTYVKGSIIIFVAGSAILCSSTFLLTQLHKYLLIGMIYPYKERGCHVDLSQVATTCHVGCCNLFRTCLSSEDLCRRL